jgi:hypothetical protein
MNILIATSWLYGPPKGLYYHDSQILMILLLYAFTLIVTCEWLLLNILLFNAKCRRIIIPDEIPVTE